MLPRYLLLSASTAITIAAIWLATSFPYSWHALVVWPFLMVYLGTTLLRYFFYFCGVAADEGIRVHTKYLFNHDEAPMVSILVPAYNEEKVLHEALLSLSRLNYPSFEIIVIDDGSSDRTFELAKHFASEVPVPVEVLHKPNGGKASALNLGLTHASGSLILCVDADSRLHPDSLINGVVHFHDPKVGAVAGFVELAKTNSLLLKFQQLEYQVGLNFLRRAYSFFGTVPIIPGPIGLFRREALTQLGGYSFDRHLFAEDAEMSLRMIAGGWAIRSEPSMIAYTEAPENWRALLQQRYRWNRGTFQALRANWQALTHAPYLRAQLLAWHLFLELWAIPLVNLTLMLWFSIFWVRFGSSSLFTEWMAMILLVELLVTAVGIVNQGRLLHWFSICIISRFTYDILLFLWRVVCLFDEWTEQPMNWDKLKRTGAIAETGR